MKRLACLLAVCLALAAPRAWAEANAVRIAMPFGLGYLPVYVAADRGLFQKYATEAGLGTIDVSIRNLASGPVTSDLILAGEADIGMGGWGPAFVMWDKTRGDQKVRAIMPLSSAKIIMESTDPRIHSLRDFREGDKIGISAIKVTDQAVTLEMAAAKEWGWDERFRLDPLTVSISNPDGMAALLSGGEMKNHFTIIPFSAMEEETGKVHRVMTSDDYVPPGSSGTLMYAPARFHDPNPKLYAAVVAAFEEAIRFVNQNPKEAAEIYLHREPQKHDADWIAKIVGDPTQIVYSSTPRGIQVHADFMAAVGTLKHKADSWKDLFWDNMKDRDGD